jgi:hypothetical protein
VAQIRWPFEAKDQIAFKSLVLAPANKVDSAALLTNEDGEKNVWLLMKRKDCRLLGRIADKFPGLESKPLKWSKKRLKSCSHFYAVPL